MDIITDCKGRYMKHPAWEAADKKLTDDKRWIARAQGLPAGYYDWEIALAMIVAGYGDDVIVTARTEDGRPAAYEFPPYRILNDEEDEEALPVNPAIDPAALVEYHKRNWVKDLLDGFELVSQGTHPLPFGFPNGARG